MHRTPLLLKSAPTTKTSTNDQNAGVRAHDCRPFTLALAFVAALSFLEATFIGSCFLH